MQLFGPRFPASSDARFGWGVLIAWAGFWLLMLAVGVQENQRNGGRDAWRPFVDYGSAALVATAIAVWQVRKADRFDALRPDPLRWFGRLAAWLAPVALVYVGALYALRHAIYALAGSFYKHEPWGEVFLYETVKFSIFYALFAGVHFGLRSYQAWNAERLRTAHQANLARQAQLAQLTQQLHPHFLFNALNTVSSLIHSDPDLADTLLTRFATLLRAATDAGGRPSQSLDEELKLLEAYAQIMTQRFADRVEIRWEIAADARACKLPTLGLQPLLENCFRHVVERRRRVTHIVVRACRIGADLRVEVEDDGDALDEPVSYGVGLRNLQERLHAMHGERGRLTLSARGEGGLTVCVELPCEC